MTAQLCHHIYPHKRSFHKSLCDIFSVGILHKRKKSHWKLLISALTCILWTHCHFVLTKIIKKLLNFLVKTMMITPQKPFLKYSSYIRHNAVSITFFLSTTLKISSLSQLLSLWTLKMSILKWNLDQSSVKLM